jgi:hypothetical protein
MRYLLTVLILSTFWSHATDHNVTRQQTVPGFQCKKEHSKKEQHLVRRGCCSHHGGVCGCAPSGRQQCCDGTLSPTCTCFRNQAKGKNI